MTAIEPQSITSDEKTMGIVSHLITFCGYIVPFGNIIGPLVVWLVKKDSSDYIRHHALEALNFQITITVLSLVAALLILVFIGIILLPLVLILNLVLTIIAAVKASEGNYYRYPFSIRLVG